jgi:type IV pilus assembly protein PilA
VGRRTDFLPIVILAVESDAVRWNADRIMRELQKSGEESCSGRFQRGFSLIELLVVVAIILIIAAIAIPNFLRSKMAANESSAVNTMRAVFTAQTAYNTTYGVGYGTLVQLGTPAIPCTPTPASACLLDPALSLGSKSGYTISVAPLGANNSGFEAAAVPMNVGKTGERTFCEDETGVIRVDITAGPDPKTDVACEAFPPLP